MSALSFQKWEATGNDFLFIDAEAQGVGPDSFSTDQIRAACDRKSGFGADGVVLYTVTGNQSRMVIFNSDGSMGDMCGNALRCLARILCAHTGQSEHTVDLTHRTVTVRAEAGLRGTVQMGRPAAQKEFSLFANLSRLDEIMGGEGSLLSFGNPHYVVPFSRLPDDWEERGARCQGPAHELLGTGGINCGFLETEPTSGVHKLRVYERGAGATKSCGSGACAASAVLERCLGKAPPHELSLTGGVLSLDRQGEEFLLSGAVSKEYDGVWKI